MSQWSHQTKEVEECVDKLKAQYNEEELKKHSRAIGKEIDYAEYRKFFKKKQNQQSRDNLSVM